MQPRKKIYFLFKKKLDSGNAKAYLFLATKV